MRMPVDVVLSAAKEGALRMRAFGETSTWGEGRLFASGSRSSHLRRLRSALLDGSLRAYCDEDGLFVGPPNPAYVDQPLEAAS